ncbi:MAG: hypothetical protein SCJ93_14605, partial [Bacillota bacterium]|nr:hypothetical protein [Bacillota bacterium]
SDAPEGELLYIVHGIIDTWSKEKAEMYAKKGYVHYHELMSVEHNGELHPNKVVWLKHTARTSFTFDGGPMAGMMDPHDVTPGVDYMFMPNGMMEYTGEAHHDM